MKSLNKLRHLRKMLVRAKFLYYTKFWGMDIHPTVQISLKANLDRTFPKGMHIAEYSYIAFNATLLSHDFTRGLHTHTYIGRNCFIGANSTIMPGITVGENSVIGAGAVVTKDVPPRSIVVGNPGKVLKSDIEVGRYGRFYSADKVEAELKATGTWE